MVQRRTSGDAYKHRKWGKNTIALLSVIARSYAFWCELWSTVLAFSGTMDNLRPADLMCELALVSGTRVSLFAITTVRTIGIASTNSCHARPLGSTCSHVPLRHAPSSRRLCSFFTVCRYGDNAATEEKLSVEK